MPIYNLTVELGLNLKLPTEAKTEKAAKELVEADFGVLLGNSLLTSHMVQPIECLVERHEEHTVLTLIIPKRT